MPVLLVVALVFGVLSLVAFVSAIQSLRDRRLVRSGLGGLFGLLFVALTAASGVLAAATHGFRALTREEVAAVLEVRPTDEHRFEATVHLPEKEPQTFQVRGDQVYVDARIVKWEPVVNVLGLHTEYELHRLAGRYRGIEMAKNAPRSVFALGQERYIDIVRLIERFPLFEMLVDAEYGSATFVEVDRERMLEVRVGTAGLLIREATPGASPEQLLAD